MLFHGLSFVLCLCVQHDLCIGICVSTRYVLRLVGLPCRAMPPGSTQKIMSFFTPCAISLTGNLLSVHADSLFFENCNDSVVIHDVRDLYMRLFFIPLEFFFVATCETSLLA